MKYLGFLITVAILFVALPAGSSEEITEQSLTSQGKKHDYYLFVPDTVKAPAPLLILFHDYAHNAFSLVQKWTDIASREGIILAGPDVLNSSRGWRIPEDGPEFVFNLAEDLKANYPIDPLRIYLFGHSGGASLFGHSGGANFALTMSMLESQYFAATAIHAGAWQSSQFSLTDSAKRKIPIAIFVGERDQEFLASVLATSERLKQKGFNVELTTRPGYNHLYYDLAGSLNEQIWSFLKRYGLSEQPVYDRYSFDK